MHFKGLFCILISVILHNVISAQIPNLIWGKNFGGDSNNDGYASVNQQLITKSGNIYNAGSFGGTVDLNSDPNKAAIFSSLGSSAYVQKLDAAANFIWAYAFTNEENVSITDIAADNNENIYISLKFEGTLDVDPGSNILNVSANGIEEHKKDLVVVKLNNAGIYQSHRQFTETPNNLESAELEINLQNQAVLCYSEDGDIINTLTLNPSNLSTVSSFSFGNYGGIGGVAVLDFHIDKNGSYLYTGYFSWRISFDPNDPSKDTVSNINTIDLFYSKIDAQQHLIFGYTLGTNTNSERGFGITSDENNNVYVTGYFSKGLDANPGPGIQLINSNGGTDMFLFKLNSTGTFQWAKTIGSETFDTGLNTTVDNNGNIYWVGYISLDTDVNPGEGIEIVNATSNSSIIVGLDSQGDFLWAHKLGSGFYANNQINVNHDDEQNIFIAGSFSGVSIDRDPNPNVFDPLWAAEGAAAFNLKWGFCTPIVPTVFISASSEIICNGQNITFSAQITNGGDNPDYQWYVNDVPVNSGSTWNTNDLKDGDIVRCQLTSSVPCASPAIVQSNTIIIACENVGGQSDLFFSEYIEGSGNNKALELYNPSDNTINLTDYKINLYANGGISPTSSLALSGTLSGKSVYVVANANAVVEILNVADVTSAVCNFNGNDAIELQYLNNPLDIIGIIGENPGTSWVIPSGGSTAEFTLTRNPGANAPETDWTIGKTQWTASPQNDFNNLGLYGSSEPDPTIFIMSEKDSYCEGELVLFTSTVSNVGSSPLYSWKIDGEIVGENSAQFSSSNIMNGSQVTCSVINTENSQSATSNIITMDINSLPNNAVNLSGNTITAIESNASYQWLDCKNDFQIIPNETQNNYEAVSSGSYAVRITSNITSCIDTSDCVQVTITGISENQLDAISIYPNPTNKYFIIEAEDILHVNIYNSLGQLVQNYSDVIPNSKLEIVQLATGTYFVEIINSSGKLVKNLAVE